MDQYEELQAENARLANDVDELRAVLYTILDAVDYNAGNCRSNEMVGAVLPIVLIVRARRVLSATDKS